jgi:hypothetical protein
MGNLFSRPSPPPPPPPPQIEENLDQQEEAVAREERETGRRIRARNRSRRGAGMRTNLMAPGVVVDGSRDVLQSNLGAGRNPRG